ncbi:hypothetical protein PG996_007770 [Apiospora saccharicola]|uniref:Helicase ATP-binding domain-containing protein n=1 Tax=Apiospora saccharicola TaxID=335842 RepID=A0ABR1UW22_9PEZI
MAPRNKNKDPEPFPPTKRRGRPKKTQPQPRPAEADPAVPEADPADYPFTVSANAQDLLEIPIDDWTPATDAEIAKVRGSRVYTPKAEAAGMRTHTYDFQDMSRHTTVDWWQNSWDYKEPEVLPNDDVDKAMLAKMQTPNGCFKGQTVVSNTTSKSRGYDTCAALACFDTVPAYLTYLDTHAARFFSKLTQYRERQYDSPGASADYAGLPKYLNDRGQYAGVHRVLQAVSEMEGPRELLVRNGDTNRAFQPINQRHHAHMEATILANALVALMFTSAGLDSEEKRYTRIEGEEGMKPPYHYGYHANDWLGMIVAGFYSFHIRRTRSNNQKIDGQASTAAVKAVGRIMPENMTGIVSAEQGESVAHSVAVQKSMAYREELQNLPSVGKLDPRDMGSRMRRIDNRIAWFVNAGRSVKKMTARSIALNKNKATAPKLAQVPPLDQKTLDIILKNVSRIHGKREQITVDKDSAEAVAELVCKRDGGMQSFLAAQQGVADRLTQKMEDTRAMSRDEAKEEVEEVMRHSWAIGKMSSSSAVETVDFPIVLEAFGLDPTKPQPENLVLNPVGNPDFKVLHHQLVDAYLMREKEKSIIGGALLAADVGTGKTISVFTLMVLEYMEIRKKAEAGEPFEARPTLMIVPAGLIGQTFNECDTFFGGMIDVKCHYGVATQFKGTRQIATLDDQRWEEEAAYAFDPNTVTTDPKNCLKMFLNTYSTTLSRYATGKRILIQKGDLPPDDVLVYEDLATRRKKRTFAALEEELGEDEMTQQELMTQAMEEMEEQGYDPDDKAQKKKRTRATYTHLTLRFCAHEGAMFSRVICDEAHVIRNQNSVIARMVGLFPRKHTILMTATPTINRLGDIVGLMHQIYQTSSLPMPEDFYNDSALEPEYDISTIEHSADQNEMSDTRDAVREYVKTTNNKPWALLPGAQSEISSGDLSSGRSDKVYAAATACFVVRRSMRDGVEYTVPPAEEGIAYPGQDIPPCTVITEELSMKGFDGEEDAELLRFITNKLWKKINTAGGGDGPVLPELGTMHSGDKSKDGRVNMNVHRHMLLNAFDLRTQEVFTNEDKLSGSVTVDLIERAVRTNTGPPSTLASSRKGKSKASKDKAPTLGVEQVDHLRSLDPDGGLNYICQIPHVASR